MQRKSLILICTILVLTGCNTQKEEIYIEENKPNITSTTTTTTTKQVDSNSTTTKTTTTTAKNTTTTTKSTTTKKTTTKSTTTTKFTTSKKTTTTKPTTITTSKKSTTTTTKNTTTTTKSTTKAPTTTTKKNTTTTTKAAVTLVEEKKETVDVSVDTKYGVKIIKKADIFYAYYSDGSKVEKSRVEYLSYDYSTYNATGNDLKAEARTKMNENASMYNEILNTVNGYRSEVGANPLTLNNDLTLQATIRAMEMAYTKTMSHTRPNGTDCFTLSAEVGLKQFFGENVAMGYPSAASVCNGWYNSQGHKANMQDKSYTQMGVGYYKLNGTTYWAQVFA